MRVVWRAFRKPGGECRALAQFTDDGQITTHGAADPATDCKSEPCAGEFALSGRMPLKKIFEQLFFLFGSQADSRIGHGDVDEAFAIGFNFPDCYFHPAAL